MNYNDYRAYWMPATNNLFVSGNPWELERSLGLNMLSEFANREQRLDEPISPELKSLLIQLAGPYAQAILKAYRINRGFDK